VNLKMNYQEQQRLKEERYQQKAGEVEKEKQNLREYIERLRKLNPMTEQEQNDIDYEILDAQDRIMFLDMELEGYV